MKRVEVNMSNAYRGYVEEYAEKRDLTMPQAYKELLDIGMVCSETSFDNLPIDEEQIMTVVES